MNVVRIPFIALVFWALLLPAGLLPRRGAAAPGKNQPPLTSPRLPERVPVVGYGLVNAFPDLSFRQPVALATPPGETNRLFVVERNGTICVLTNLAQPVKSLFLNLSNRVNSGTVEGGLLGLAFHPGFASNRFFYVFRTMQASTPGAPNLYHDVVSRFEVSLHDSNVALADSEVVLLAQLDDSDEHNGGDLKFGPDGYLYISIGERVNRDLTWPDQTPIDRDLQGAILRIDVDGLPGSLRPNPHPASTDHYWIPADNPFVGATQHHGLAVSPSEIRTEIYATGFRNPWRMAFDPVTGELFVSDVGGGRQEEVDLVQPGADYGWPYLEGTLTLSYTPPPSFHPAAPLHFYNHGAGQGTNGDCVIGGAVYRGSLIPALQGRYLFADFNSGYLWSLHREGESNVVGHVLSTTPGLTTFGTDPRDQEILVVQLYNGTIQRLIYIDPETATNLPPSLAETGLFEDLATLTPNPGVVPYDINVPFWSDDASKSRWFCLPQTNQPIGFNAAGPWTYPTGAVWIKHFELQLTNGQPASARRLETRVLVKATDGYYGLTYRWGESRTNAWLVPEEGQCETFTIRDLQGNILREQEWRYPARADCMNCHTEPAGRVLGFSAAQLNRRSSGKGKPENQLQALASAGYLSPVPPEPTELPALAAADDAGAPLEFRVRSHLQANCAQCHRPDGQNLAHWDGRFTTPLKQAGIVSLLSGRDLSDSGVVRPGSLDESKLYHRLIGYPRLMPPIGSTVFNSNAINLVANWITNLPPEPWSYESIGDVIHYGGSTVSNGVYRVGGTGVSLQGTNDSFQFLHRPFLAPAAHLVARLTSQSGTEDQALAGLMIREGTGNLDPFLMVAGTPDGRVLSLQRLAPDVAVESPGETRAAQPRWLRVTRMENWLEAFHSDDGTNWIPLASATWEIFGPLEAGFAVHSASRTAFNNAMFDQASYLSISLTSSAPAILQQPANLTLHAVVDASGRAVARVKFFDAARLIGVAPAAPYLLNLTNLPTGTHDFSALAVDEAGAVVESTTLRHSVLPHATLVTPVVEEPGQQGTWPGQFGAKGYVIVNHATNLPATIKWSVTGGTATTWDPNTLEPRALLKVRATNRIAACWTAPQSFTVSLQNRDGGLYRLSLYCLDWDTDNERVQEVEFLDPDTGSVLMSHLASNFTAGIYLTATVRGNLDIRLTGRAGPGPVLSGLFLDTGSNAPPSVQLVEPVHGLSLSLPAHLTMEATASDADGQIERVEFRLNGELAGVAGTSPYRVVFSNVTEGTHTLVAVAYDQLGDYHESSPVTFQAILPRARAAFLEEDTRTRGDWPSRYGSEAFVLPAVTNWWSREFPHEARAASTWIQLFGYEPDFLILPDDMVRAFSFYYGTGEIVHDLNLADGQPWRVSLYFFDEAAYPQQVSILDSANAKLLDARTVTNGFGGRYLVWNLQGHVLLKITNPAIGAQARLNGLFLDRFTNAAPEVHLTQPGADFEAATPAKIVLAATAESPGGIRAIEFHTAAAKLGEATRPPFEFLWEFPVAGPHEVFARAVSSAGAVADSPPVLLQVHSDTPTRVRFVQSDGSTLGNWKGIYGTEGHWLPSAANYRQLSPVITLSNNQEWNELGNLNLPRELARPNDLTRILSFWAGTSWEFQARFNDGRAHRLSIYSFAPGWTNAITVTVRATGTETILDSREIASEDAGTYLTWDIRGDVTLQVNAPTGSVAFVNGLFVDPTPDPYFDWQRRQFTLAEQANLLISGETADPDLDGDMNWVEWLLGRNPTSIDPNPPLWLEAGPGRLFLHVLVSKAAASNEVNLVSSPDLKSWTAAPKSPLFEVHEHPTQLERIYEVMPVQDRTFYYRLQLHPPWSVSGKLN